MTAGGNWDDVVFDHAGAQDLAARFRSTADLLDDQRARRDAEATSARREWRGRFAEEFDARTAVCRGDALRLAAAMRQAAAGLEQLAASARAEQERREAARRWERQQEERNLLQKVGDGLHDLVFGQDLPRPPDPCDPPRVIAGDDGLVGASRG
jgi:uncharacterized protein YukE